MSNEKTPPKRKPFEEHDTTFTKLFVGGLPYKTTDETLHEYFAHFGDIEEAVVITDRESGKSKGYGFVTFHSPTAAERACLLRRPIIEGRRANVNLAYLGAKPRANHIPGSRSSVNLLPNVYSPGMGLATPPPYPYYPGMGPTPLSPQVLTSPFANMSLASNYPPGQSMDYGSPYAGGMALGPAGMGTAYGVFQMPISYSSYVSLANQNTSPDPYTDGARRLTDGGHEPMDGGHGCGGANVTMGASQEAGTNQPQPN